MSGFPCMLASGFDAKRIENYPVAVETKFDGFRALFVIRPGESRATCYSRSGKEYTSVYSLCRTIEKGYAEMARDDGLVLDGELYCGDFRSTSSQIRKKNQEAPDAKFHCFDEIKYTEWDGTELPSYGFMERREILMCTLDHINDDRIILSTFLLAHSEDQIIQYFRDKHAAGFEGIIVKLLDSKYHPLRSIGWMKMKGQESEDLIVTGCIEGQGKYVGTLGAIQVDFNGVQVACGTGFTDEERHKIWALHEAGELVGLMAEIEYHEMTPDGSMRHPAFKGFRFDK